MPISGDLGGGDRGSSDEAVSDAEGGGRGKEVCFTECQLRKREIYSTTQSPLQSLRRRPGSSTRGQPGGLQARLL
jgi:hypothetical protein